MQTAQTRPRRGAIPRPPPRREAVRGPGAAARKYDVLTALAAAGLMGGPAERTSALRLIAMVTARYDWNADSIAVGQEELARLWGTSLRTAKREVKRLTGSGVLARLVPGVRGRVGVYRLDRAGLRRLTEPAWERVGPDFAERMGADEEPAEALRVEVAPPPASEEGEGGSAWARVRRDLHAADPAAFAAWYEGLTLSGRDGAAVRIGAPSRFVAAYVGTHLAGPLEGAVRRRFGAEARPVLVARGPDGAG